MADPRDERTNEQLIASARNFCDEIDRLEEESIGWGYQWEHLGDASKDVHTLMRLARELAGRLQHTEQERDEWKDACGRAIENGAGNVDELHRRLEQQRLEAEAFTRMAESELLMLRNELEDLRYANFQRKGTE